MLTSTSLCSGIALLPYAVRALHDFSSLLSHFGVHTFFPNVSVIFFFFHSRFHADVSGHA